MTPETEARVRAFRRALERAADEPVLSTWRGYIGSFPRGTCKLAEYLTEDGCNLHPYHPYNSLKLTRVIKYRCSD